MQHELMNISNNMSTTAKNLGRVAYALGTTSNITAEQLGILIPVLKASKVLLHSAPAVYAAATGIAVGTGFAAGKMIDTNDNPSNFKTAATVYGSNILSGAVAGALGRALVGAQLSKLDISNVTELSPSELRKALKDAKNNLPTDSNQIGDAVFQEAGINRQEFDGLLKDTNKAFLVAGALASVVGLANMGMTVSNAIHGYRRNDKSIGYALAWMATGPGGFGLSRSQGWGQPIGK